jgi:hypothetical protein
MEPPGGIPTMKYKLMIYLILIVTLAACATANSEGGDKVPPVDSPTPPPPSTNTPSPTMLPTNTPTLSIEEWFTNQVEIEEVRLFNADEDPDSSAYREYSNNFGQADAKVIYCELDLMHPGLKERKEFVMQAIYFYQDGSEYGKVEIEPVVESGWTDSNWVVGFGWDDPGRWDVGTYRVDVYVGDEIISSESFEIEPEPTPTPTSTPQPLAVVNTTSLNVREGPGIEYALVTDVTEGEDLEIIGQAYHCTWLKIETLKEIEGWVSSELVSYEIPCENIPSLPIPPTPKPKPATSTPEPASKPTAEPSGKTVKVRIVNDTGGTLTLNLNGPASYNFNLGPGKHTINVIPGTYNYTVWGCGTSESGSQKLKKGFEWTWYCS